MNVPTVVLFISSEDIENNVVSTHAEDRLNVSARIFVSQTSLSTYHCIEDVHVQASIVVIPIGSSNRYTSPAVSPLLQVMVFIASDTGGV